ncbi:MAG: hypothetical protein KKH68_14115 [Proteobacteria bacterium]|nr:hypothetical protein [Pseudomonadota bacterium]
MTKRLSIPEEFQGTFQRLMKLLSFELCNDVQTQNTVWVYLKFGGEKLARHGIEIIKQRFREEIEAESEDSPDQDAEDLGVDTFGDSGSANVSYSDSDKLDVDDDDDDVDDDDADDYPI